MKPMPKAALGLAGQGHVCPMNVCFRLVSPGPSTTTLAGANLPSNQHPLDLIEADLVAPPVIELCRPG